MARVLEMGFSTELGKTQIIRVYDAKADLTTAEVKTAMDSIVTQNIFSGTGGPLTGKVSARVINTEATDISLS